MNIDLKKYRKEKRMSQSEIASLLGASIAQYQTWENNSSIPYKYTDKLADILGYDLSMLNLFTPESMKAIRVLAGLTQNDMAAFLGVTQQNYVKLEQTTKAGFDKYEDALLDFFQKKLKGKPMIPVQKKKVPGAIIMSFLDECYILISDSRLFNEEKYLFHPIMKVHKYNVAKDD